MADIVIDVEVSRPRAEVLAWWTGFPDDYSATDPREQPHRIVVKRRASNRIEILTWWRAPLGRELIIPETFRLHDSGDFEVDVHLPFGLAQVDRFTFTERDGVTHVHVEFDLWARNPLGKLARPGYLRYARRAYPATFRHAASLCARDAPRVGA